MAPVVNHAKIEAHLGQVAMSLTQAALHCLATLPKGSPILCSAVVMQASGQASLIAIRRPEHRIEALRSYVQDLPDVVGFALLFDGYVSTQCDVCGLKGCPKCKAAGLQLKPRIDAIVSIIRTAWGTGSTASLAYGYAADGTFELRPERNELAPTMSGMLDNYDTVFKPATVN